MWVVQLFALMWTKLLSSSVFDELADDDEGWNKGLKQVAWLSHICLKMSCTNVGIAGREVVCSSPLSSLGCLGFGYCTFYTFCKSRGREHARISGSTPFFSLLLSPAPVLFCRVALKCISIFSRWVWSGNWGEEQNWAEKGMALVTVNWMCFVNWKLCYYYGFSFSAWSAFDLNE